MIRLKSLMNEFDDVINDANDLLTEPTIVGNTTQYETRTTADDESGTSSTSRQTTSLLINIKGRPSAEPVVTGVKGSEPTSSECTDKEGLSCDVCAPRKMEFPPLNLSNITDNETSPLPIPRSLAKSIDTASMMSASSTETDDNVNESDDSTDDVTAATDADLALDSMIDDLCKLTDESFYDDEKDENRKSTHSRGSFTARKRYSRVKPGSLTEEQKLRFSIANFVEGTTAELLDDLLDDDDHARVERQMSRPSASRIKGLFEDLGIMEPMLESDQSSQKPPSFIISGAKDGQNIDPEVFSTEPNKLGAPPLPTTPTTPQPTEISSETLRHEQLIIEVLRKLKLDPHTEEGRKQAKKIRIGLEKIKEANLGKIVVKVWNDKRGILENVEVDQTMTARDFKRKMCQREGIHPGPEWCIAEKLPLLFMDRILQDSDYVCQAVSDWSRNIENHFVFLKRSNRYRLFREPHNYLSTDTSHDPTESESFTEDSKKILLEEFFTKEATQVPNTEGVLWLKEGTKKWIKHYFVLRPSGIYYTPKGKQKARGIALLASFEHYNVYTCQSFKSKFKAPHDHVFAIKHPQVQTSKSKHVHVLCASSREERNRWITFIRMAKYGYAMYDDYLATKEEELAIATGRGKSRNIGAYEENKSLNAKTELPKSAESSPSLPRTQNKTEFSATFPRTREHSPKPRWDEGSSTIPRSGQASKERPTSTSSAPPDLMPPPPPPTGSVPNLIPYGEQRKKTLQKKRKNRKSSGEVEDSTSPSHDHTEE